MPRTITSLTGYVRKIQEVQPELDEVLLYRGHSDRVNYRLVPSVLRTAEWAAAEHSMLRELVVSHPAEFAQDDTTLEQLARAQHYSLPTRLLDATWNPLVALYFAAKGNPGARGEVVVFRIKKNQVKYYDSDVVSCIANLAHLKPSELDDIDFTLDLEAFNNQNSILRLLHFIGVEKPMFKPLIAKDDLRTVVCVNPKRNSQRMLVQSGAFLLFGLHGALDDDPAAGIVVERIRVSGEAKSGILEELDRVAINESTMFPEIDKAATYIRDRVDPV